MSATAAVGQGAHRRARARRGAIVGSAIVALLIGGVVAALLKDDGTPAPNAPAPAVRTGADPSIAFPTAARPQRVAAGTTSTFAVIGANLPTGATVAISGGFEVEAVRPSQQNAIVLTVVATQARGTYDLVVLLPDGRTITQPRSMVNE